MQLNLKDLDFKDGKYVYTFKPDKDFDSIDLLSDCFGDLAINHLQVEKNPDVTYFVPPEVYEGNLGGIFKDLDYLKTELKDKENSNLWAQIRISAQGMLKEYHDTEFKSALAQTAKQLTAQLEDGESLARRILTAQGFQSYMTDKDKQVNSAIIQLKDLINSKVSADGLETVFQQSGDTIWQAIQDKLDGNKIIASINMTKGVTKISNDLIQLDGNTVMDNAFAKKLLVDTLKANDVTAFVGKYSNLIAQNLDVNNLSGNLAKLGQAIFDGKNSRVRIDPTGMQVMTTSGDYSTKFGDNGIEIWRSGSHTGSVHSLDADESTGYYQGRKSMSFTTQPESYLSFEYYPFGDNRPRRAWALGGDGRMRLHVPFYAGDTNYGYSITNSEIKSEKTQTEVVQEEDVLLDKTSSLEATNDHTFALGGTRSSDLSKYKNADILEVDGQRFKVKRVYADFGMIYVEVEETVGSGYSMSNHFRLLKKKPPKRIVKEGRTVTGSGLRDVMSGGGMITERNGETWVSGSGGFWYSITQLNRDLTALKNTVDSMSRSSGGGGWNAKGYEPSGDGIPYYKDTDGSSSNTDKNNKAKTGNSSNVSVGDIVVLKSGVRTWYHDQGWSTGIPSGYESRQYTVGGLRGGNSGNVLLMSSGIKIAWARKEDVYKV